MQAISLCSTHQREGRKVVPQGCNTCRRINIERDIVLRTVDALLAAGYAVGIDEDGDHFYGPSNPTRSSDVIIPHLMETDDEYLGVFPAEDATGEERVVRPIAWVYFVYGNDGYDVISDYTTNLDPALKPVFDYIRETYE